MMEALIFSETPVFTRVTRRNIPEDGILHTHRRENLKFYKFASMFASIHWISYISVMQTQPHIRNEQIPSVTDEIAAVEGRPQRLTSMKHFEAVTM
jgi:hypothetical protein